MTEQAASRMEETIRTDGIEHVFIEFADLNGISRVKQLDAEYFLDTWEKGFPMNLLLLVQTPRSDVPQGSGLGEEIDYGDGLIHPDPTTFQRLPWREDAARVFCDFEHEGSPVPVAPRTALQRLLSDLPSDLDVFVGSELEFHLVRPVDTGYEPATSDKHECIAWATEAVTPFYTTLKEWADEYGIDIQSMQHEHGPGQLEILFDYGSPLSQADATFDFKRVVKQAARSHGFRATFMAKPFTAHEGNGYHLHVSAFDGNENAFDAQEGTLSDIGRSFVGGLLEHADALAALGTPTLNSFKRYSPGGFAPYTASWGLDNRMTAIRIPQGTTRIENRIASADANPYLVIASTLAAGIDGIERELDPGEPIAGDPVGRSPRLPHAPELALRALEADDLLVDRLGAELVRAYTATKREELERFRDHVSDWERRQYLETL